MRIVAIEWRKSGHFDSALTIDDFALLIWGIALPIVTYFWYRVIDEQEFDAYRTGPHYGMSLFAVAVPIWWFLWRGGILPAVDIVIVYYSTILMVGVVWMYKKYF